MRPANRIKMNEIIETLGLTESQFVGVFFGAIMGVIGPNPRKRLETFMALMLKGEWKVIVSNLLVGIMLIACNLFIGVFIGTYITSLFVIWLNNLPYVPFSLGREPWVFAVVAASGTGIFAGMIEFVAELKKNPGEVFFRIGRLFGKEKSEHHAE